MTPEPFDYLPASATIAIVLGSLGAGMAAMLGTALLIRAVRWGVPRIIAFFQVAAAERDFRNMSAEDYTRKHMGWD